MSFCQTFFRVALLLFIWQSISGYADDSKQLQRPDLAEMARRGLVVVQIRAALMDRKDIRSRYIRVRFDGKTIELAGFVKNLQQGKQVVEIAQAQESEAEVKAYWLYEEDLEEHDPYKTRVQEQKKDAEIWLKIQLSLCSPAGSATLGNSKVQAVDVRKGEVRVFLILDSPQEDLDITPFIKPLYGVTKITVFTLETFN